MRLSAELSSTQRRMKRQTHAMFGSTVKFWREDRLHQGPSLEAPRHKDPARSKPRNRTWNCILHTVPRSEGQSQRRNPPNGNPLIVAAGTKPLSCCYDINKMKDPQSDSSARQSVTVNQKRAIECDNSIYSLRQYHPSTLSHEDFLLQMRGRLSSTDSTTQQRGQSHA